MRGFQHPGARGRLYEFDLCKHVASDTLTGASEDRGGLANTSKRPEPVEDCVLANTTLDSAGVTADASPRELSAPRTGRGPGAGPFLLAGSQCSGHLCVWSPVAGGSILWLNYFFLKKGKK